MKFGYNFPAEDPRSGDGVCGFLQRFLCGLRDAGMNFDQLTREVMDKFGFTCGCWTPCALTHREKNVQTYVYGDNFVIKGSRRELQELFQQFKTHMLAQGVSHRLCVSAVPSDGAFLP